MNRDASTTIRDATLADIATIAGLHAASWRDAYQAVLSPTYLGGPVEADRLAVWSRRLSAPPANQRVRIVEIGGVPAGFLCAFVAEDPRWGTLVDNLHVAAMARGKGLGAALLRDTATSLSAEESRQGVHLWVFEVNSPARRFYERLGGTIVERVETRTADGGTAPVLRMHWPDAKRLVD